MSLEINIVSARGLTEVDPPSKTKLYVVVSVTGAALNEQRAQTHVDKDGGGNPTWNFPVKFKVDVDRLKGDLNTRLVFALKCEDGKGSRDLGEVHVSVAELLQSAGYGNSMLYVAVSYPVRKPSGKTVGVLNFKYKFGGSPTTDTPAADYATRSMGVYPPQPQGYNYHPPPPAAGYGGYPPHQAAGYGGYQPPPQPSGPYPPSSPSHYTPPAYPPYNVGPPAAPSYYTPSPAYPPYNVGLPSASPYPPYNVGPSAAPPYGNQYPPHASHVQARTVEQRSSVPKKKKSVWGSALGVAGAAAVGILSGVAATSFELPSVPAPDISDLTGGFQIPDPSGYVPQDLSFINTFPDPSALRDATYVDYSSLV